MAHSVAQHLAVSPAAYDVEIRRFIPGYDTLLDEVAGAAAELLPPAAHLLDLGAGTGSLTERVAQAMPQARFTLIDADADMLAEAAKRLVPVSARVTQRQGSFTAPLPPCDGAIASFSLHHVHDAGDKRALFRNLHAAIAPGGVLVVADAMLPDAGPLAAPLRRRWAAHLMANGDSEAEAYARFAEWAKEDRYYSVDEELAAIKAGGFATVEVRWRVGPTAVVVAVR